jgi:hypothetical protein
MKIPKLRGNNLTISWIGTISCVALIASLAALVLNAFTIKDTSLFAACLTIAAIATNGVGALGGHLQKEDDVLKQAEISFEGGSPRIEEKSS